MRQPKKLDGQILKIVMNKARVKKRRAQDMTAKARRQYLVPRRNA